MAMAAFLEQPGIVRMVLFQFSQYDQGVGYAAQVPLADRHHIKDITVPGHVRE
jgi:hypothetical protein